MMIIIIIIKQANTSNSNDVSTFLTFYGRRVDQVLGDGNCMFRSLAKQLSDNSNNHAILRDNICEFISLNSEKFQGFVTEGLTLEEHLNTVRKQGTFGTQLELKTASTLFQLNIYVATNSLLSSGYYIWTLISPLTQTTCIEDKKWPIQFNSQKKSWLEICHQNGCHYDAVKPVVYGKHITTLPPPLKKQESLGIISLVD